MVTPNDFVCVKTSTSLVVKRFVNYFKEATLVKLTEQGPMRGKSQLAQEKREAIKADRN